MPESSPNLGEAAQLLSAATGKSIRSVGSSGRSRAHDFLSAFPA